MNLALPQESFLERDDAVALLSALRELSALKALPEVMEVVRRHARSLTGADGVTFVLREGPLVHYADEDALTPLWKGQRFPASACVSGWAIEHRQAVVIEDIYADDRIPHAAYRPTFVKSLAMMPIRLEDPLGAIGAYWARHHRATARELGLLQALADATSVALENSYLLQREREAVRKREEFLTVAAHELRTPVTALKLQLTALVRALSASGFGSPQIDAKLGAIGRSSERLVALVAHLLEASHTREVPLPVAREPIDLGAAVRETADALADLFVDAGSTLEVRGEAQANLDRRKLEAIVSNLLVNAAKYGGGKPVRVELHGEGDGVRIVVADQGIGIAPDDHARIFERFGRAVSERNYGGLGLGLWLARTCAEALGGSISVESQPGEGARFTVRLPRG